MLSTIVARGAAADTSTAASDVARTGWYANQTTLSPSLLSGGTFGQLFNTTVDGQIYAQPLVSQGTVFVATEKDNIYGLDPVNGNIKWGPRSVGVPWNPADIGCADLTPWIGVSGTPVIDPATNTAYFLAKTYVSGTSGPAMWQAHAVDVASGAERPNFPVTIQGAAANNPGRTFQATTQMQRPGLLLMNGVVYAGFGAHCDHSPWAGWIAAITTSGQLKTMWTTIGTTNLGGAGLWSPGGGLTSDRPGRIFFATGNGAVSSTLTHPIPGNTPPLDLGQSVVRVDVQPDGSLKANDFFAPFDAGVLDQNDQDLGSGGPVALPALFGAGTSTPNLLVQNGKQGAVYLLDRNNLGGFQQGPGNSDAVVTRVGPYGGVWGRPAVWGGDGGYIYTVPSTGGTGALNGYMHAFKYGVDGSNHPTLSLAGSSPDPFGFGSGSPVVTSNGTTSGTGLVWSIWSANGNGTNAQLRAYDTVPVNGTLNLRWSAPIGTSSKFTSPAVDNDRVYVGTRDGTVRGFGSPVSAPVTVGPLNFPNTVVGQSSVVNATITANANVNLTGLQSSNPAFSVGAPAGGLPRNLSSGQATTVPVTFTPTTPGLASGNLTVTTDQGAVAAGLSGSGQAATAYVVAQPQVLSIEGVAVGSSATGSVTYSNLGAQAATVSSATGPATPFSASGLPGPGATIPPNGSLSVTVTFTPTVAGNFSDQIVLVTNAGTVTVPVTGSAAGPAHLNITPLNVGFGNVPVGSSGNSSFTVSNTGDTALTITKSKPPALNNGFTASTSLAEGTAIAPHTTLTETVGFTASAQGPFSDTWVITGDDGSGVQTVTFSATGTPAFAVPPPIAGGWTLNGSAGLANPVLQLTPAVSGTAGSAFWPVALPSGYLSASFDANIDTGTGADGLTFVLADPAQGATGASLGTNGGGLGFSGIPGVAVALDTFQTSSNPSANFVGISPGPITTGGDLLNWIATNSNIPPLRNATVHVVVQVANGTMTVSLNGVVALTQAVTLGPQVLVGFTGGTGGFNDRHAVSNVAIGSSTAPPTSMSVSTSVVAPVGSPQLGQTFTYTGTCPSAFSTAAVGNGTSVTPPLTGAQPGSACAVTQSDPGAGWTTTVSINGGPAQAVTASGGTLHAPTFSLGGGQNTAVFTNQFAGSAPANVPPPTAGGWKLNGTSTLAGASLQLTPATPSVKGSAFWPTAISSANIQASFDASSDSGSGGEGLTFVFGDPTKGAKPSSLGGNGGLLGFGGIPGIAVAIDTHKNASDPSSNFVGISIGKGTKTGTLAWLATSTTVPPLRNAPIHVDLGLVAGQLTVKINGVQVLSNPVTLPPQVLVGFSASTGSTTDRHAVNNVTIGTRSSVPDPTSGGWTLNGTTSLANPYLQLTPAALTGAAGSAFWPTALSTTNLRASFDVNIDSGSGADGLAFVLADPSKGATPASLGIYGGGLGFAGIPGVAVALDTYQGAGNPSGNFVGLSDGPVTPGGNTLHWLSTNTNVVPLRNSTLHVTVIVNSSSVTMLLNGVQVLSTLVTVPPSALVGFSGGSGGLTDRHAISNVSITYP